MVASTVGLGRSAAVLGVHRLSDNPLLQLVGIVVAGVAAQWLAWRLRFPSILLLLLVGIIAGPVTGWLNPDALFGDLLLPLVSLSVGVILFEGGLTLRIAELKGTGEAVRNLVTIGAVITCVLSAAAAHFAFGLDPAIAALLGGILVVTGPTVVGPMLRHMRPTGPSGAVLRWEGIIIDPIGALLTVLIFEIIVAGQAGRPALNVALGIGAAAAIGLAAAAVLVVLIWRHWIADFLDNPATLMLVAAAFGISNEIQHESGLLAVTVMGFALANQKRADIGHILEFKENLRVLLISALFIVLGARLEQSQIVQMLVPAAVFTAILILVVRPLAVFASTLGSSLKLKDRLLVASLAPRGIVAAAVAAVFALRLETLGYGEAWKIVPVTFIVIILTVTLYGVVTPWVARAIGLANANPQGILFAGADEWVRQLAGVLKKEGFVVALVDNNWSNVRAARMAGLRTYPGSIVAERTFEALDLGGIGRLFAVTPNDWVNVLAVQRFEHIFGRSFCYQIPPPQKDAREEHKYLHGRWLFAEQASHPYLRRRLGSGYVIKSTKLSEEFDYAAFRAHYRDSVLPLVSITRARAIYVYTVDRERVPQPGEVLISLVPAEQNATASDKT